MKGVKGTDSYILEHICAILDGLNAYIKIYTLQIYTCETCVCIYVASLTKTMHRFSQYCEDLQIISLKLAYICVSNNEVPTKLDQVYCA